MKTSVFHKYNLSKFMLGTVQFGQSYGIANKAGRPLYKTVLKLLECAISNGVNCLDTASSYDDSEVVVGQAIRDLDMTDKIVVVTKLPAMNDNLNPLQADNFIEQAAKKSLKRLQLNILPIYLFHQERNMIYADSLQKMKEKGLVEHIGISVNSPDGALEAIRSGCFEAIQLPTSILDQRYLKNDIFHKARCAGIALFVRSVYLQGLLFLPENEVPTALSAVIEVRRRLEQLAIKADMNLAEIAVRFVMSLESVSCLVLGLETIDQLQANLKLFEQGSLDAKLLQDIRKVVPQLPDSVIVPALWPKMPR